MKNKIFFALSTAVVTLFICSTPAFAKNGNGKNMCLTCHSEQKAQYDNADNVHASYDIACTDCHGGDPAQIDKDAAHVNFKGKPHGKDLSELCGSCHSNPEYMAAFRIPTDQLAKYKTSHHGKKLYENDDNNVATCLSCHTNKKERHLIRKVKDSASPVARQNLPYTCAECHANKELMQKYNLPSDVFDNYKKSVHGKKLLEEHDRAVPNCASCHGSHGATPPDVAHVSDVCGNCHSKTREYFRESPHYGSLNECVECHSNHYIAKPSREMLKGDGRGHCGSCHSGDMMPKGLELASKIYDEFAGIDEQIKVAEGLIMQAEKTGFYMEDEKGFIEDARREMTHIIPLIHTASYAKIEPVMRKSSSLIEQAKADTNKKLQKASDRKTIGAVVAAFIVFFAGIVFLKFRGILSKGLY